MDQARLLIAIALSFIIFLVWQLFFVEKQPVQQPSPISKEEAKTSQVPYTQEKEKAVDLKSAAPSVSADSQRQARLITVRTPLYTVKISERGGIFTSFILNQFRENVEGDAPLKELVSQGGGSGTLQFDFTGNSIPGLANAVFETDSTSEIIEVNQRPRALVFRWQSPEGIVVERRFQFAPQDYVINHSIIVKNGSNRSIEGSVALSLFNSLPAQASRFGFEGPSALINEDVEEVKIKDIKEKNVVSGNVQWIAVQDIYFISSIIPSVVEESSMRLFTDSNMLRAEYVQPTAAISSGMQHSFDCDLYIGPKSVQVLKAVGRGLDKAVDFGWFGFIAKPLLWLMNFLYSIIPNYGIAIIILTVMTKILLWPLGVKSYKSMNEMKKLQPIMAEIREKHKGDKKKMNEEIMGLYKTYKINPMGGCLPMIAQIPVFFALYRMLYQAIELRHAPFFGWINDLSAPDRLFRFDFAVPFMQEPYGIPVLTLVMGGTMFLQQKMTPSPGDPSQAKMMMLMPVVFTFIFINFSSGLVLYWLINNVLSISQQYYITKKLA